MKAWSRICALATTTMLVFLGTGGPAHGKAPGPNGRIAFERFDPTLGHDVIYTANPDGSHQQQLYPWRWVGVAFVAATAVGLVSFILVPTSPTPWS